MHDDGLCSKKRIWHARPSLSTRLDRTNIRFLYTDPMNNGLMSRSRMIDGGGPAPTCFYGFAGKLLLKPTEAIYLYLFKPLSGVFSPSFSRFNAPVNFLLKCWSNLPPLSSSYAIHPQTPVVCTLYTALCFPTVVVGVCVVVVINSQIK